MTVLDARASTQVFAAGELGDFSELDRVLTALRENPKTSAGNLWGSAQAFVLAALNERAQGPWLVVVSSEPEAASFADDLAAFGASAVRLPAREKAESIDRGAHADLDTLRARLQVAQLLAGPPERRPRLIVASLLSLLQPVPAASDLEKNFLVLTVHQELDREALLVRLIQAGFTREPLAEKPGEVSLRGEILDVYPFTAELPLRVEFFGDEIESLRTFDPVDQRSVEKTMRAEISLASDAGGVEDGSGVLPISLLSPTTVWVEVEPLRIEDRAGGLRIQSPAHARALMQLSTAQARLRRLELQSLPGSDISFDTRSVQALAVGMREAPRALHAASADGTRFLVLCQTEAEEHRFRALLAESAGPVAGRVETRIGSVSRGFRFPALRLALVNHRELTGILGRRNAPKSQPAHRVRAIQSFFELKIGDIVVHAVHGLARYSGLKRMERSGGEEEHLHLVFAEEVSLFVPASRIDLVQRYIGTGSSAPLLDKIGSQSFRRRKEKVERALYDLASELLEVQARRALKNRAAWPEDDELVRDMIGSFLYTDTPDQVEVDRDIRTDLAGERPMDRLLCGDVGFGKTELAVRAAFRVVNGGGQVAVLVPTTVLAQQHFDTFSTRLADFPVAIGVLSRYVTGAQEKETIEKLATGEIDIVVGTHRILSQDIRFKNLGLVVIDEEQRFGVTHKEWFKKMRANIDLLTMTATPIPRTLHMSLSGVRDISALTTPPEGRQEIETLLGYSEDGDALRTALLHEKNRGGQVFFLHNRVESIVQRAQALQRLAPECSYAIGHGQMGARELKRVMDAFIRGDVDVLVATTIIESGIDIPAAGTIVIDDADQFGLSELHQLRGRVGRGANQAYCYLLIEKTKPIRAVARERLKALEEMSQLGAGFAISMKDLEIRGAGNILGPQQSGNIGAVGYDMYCRLLKQTIDRLHEGGDVGTQLTKPEEEGGVELELGLRAFLPEDWVPDPKTRVELLRVLATIQSAEDTARCADMLRDRFGRVPPEAQNLLRTFQLKADLERMTVTRLSWRAGFYLIEYSDRVALERGIDLRNAELRSLRTGVAHLQIPARRAGPVQALDWFEDLLKRSPEPSRMPTSKRR